MSTRSSNSNEANDVTEKSISNNRIADNTSSSGVLAREAQSAGSSFQKPDISSATQGLVNEGMLPPLQINGDKNPSPFLNIADKMPNGGVTSAGKDKMPYAGFASSSNDSNSYEKIWNSGDKTDKGAAADELRRSSAGGETKKTLGSDDVRKGIPPEQLKALEKTASSEDKDYVGEFRGVADSIGRDGSLGSGQQEEANRKAIEKHMENGTLKEFIDDVNRRLAQKGSQYRVSAEQFKERMKYTEDAGNKAKVPDQQVRENNRARITVIDTDTGRRTRTVVAHDPPMRGYLNPKKDDSPL